MAAVPDAGHPGGGGVRRRDAGDPGLRAVHRAQPVRHRARQGRPLQPLPDGRLLAEPGGGRRGPGHRGHPGHRGGRGTAPQDGATTDPGTGGQGQPVDPETGTDPGTGGQQTLDPGTGDTGGTGDGGTGGTGGEQGQDGTGGTGEQEQDGTGGQGQQAPQGGTGGGSNGGAAPQSQDLGTG
ncbi:hypothetical protein ACFQXA_35125 [Nocardiopsis composta]